MKPLLASNATDLSEVPQEKATRRQRSLRSCLPEAAQLAAEIVDENLGTTQLVFEVPPKDPRIYTTDGRYVGDVEGATITKETGGNMRIVLTMNFLIDPVTQKVKDPTKWLKDPDAEEAAGLDLGEELNG